MDIDEPIALSDYNPVWPARFILEKQAILNVLPNDVRAIEHFGSTSVADLIAKPIIDILVGVRLFPIGVGQIRALEGLHYEYLGEAGIPGRFYFRKRHEQAFNISVVEWNGRLWNDNLLLRDFLRSHPEYASKYGEIKKAAIAAGATTLLTYSAHKNEFMARMVEQARSSRGNLCP